MGRSISVGFRRAAAFGLVLAVVAPACAGRSIRSDDDDGQSPGGPWDDDGQSPGNPGDDDVSGDDDGSVGIGGSSVGGSGIGAGGSVAGHGPTPPPPVGGTSAGGTFAGATSAGGSSAGTIAIGGGSPGGTTGTGSTCNGIGDIAGGTGGTTPPNADPECKGIRSNMACSLEGKACPSLVCGLGDSGRRQCNCATTWTCTACDYSNSPFRDRCAEIPLCPVDAADEVPCAVLNTVCGPVAGEYCACYQSPYDGLIWDCDNPPSTWN